jgi:hypothetical protein
VSRIVENKRKLVLEVLPEKGYIAKNTMLYGADDNLICEGYVETVGCINGKWIPLEGVSKRYGVGEKEPYKSTMIKISNVEINPIIDESQFAINALKLPANLPVLRYSANGDLRKMVWNGEETIPYEIVSKGNISDSGKKNNNISKSVEKASADSHTSYLKELIIAACIVLGGISAIVIKKSSGKEVLKDDMKTVK